MGIGLNYHNLVRHHVPGPQSFSYFIPLTLLPIALLTPRRILLRWQSIVLFMPVMSLATIHAWTVMDGVDVISVDVLLWCLIFLVLYDPWRDFKYLRTTHKRQSPIERGDIVDEDATLIDHGVDQSQQKVWEQSYPATLTERIPWVGRLLVSLRLLNWKIGQPSHDKGQPVPPAFDSRWPFVRQTLFSFIRGCLALDLTRAYIDYDLYFTDPSMSVSGPLPFPAIQWLPPRFFRSAIIGLQAWAAVSQMFYLPCLLPVGLNALGLISDEWSPHTWAPHFGSSTVILWHGVRGFWSRYWHQAMKLIVSAPGYAVADVMKLRSGGVVRYAIITIVAFGLSGVTHMGLVPPEPLHATTHVNTVRLCVASFFWSQPIALLAEVIVAKIATTIMGAPFWQDRVGFRLRATANVAFLVAWFVLCLPLIGEAGRQLGYWRVWPLPVSLWKGLRGDGWITWPFLVR